MNHKNLVHVVVGVVLNANSEVLISLRAVDSHQGGLWEFPGGKIEPQEPVQKALKREFEEELGLTVLDSSPFIKIEHHYSDKSVLLHVWKILRFSGTPQGKEGQAIEWRALDKLRLSDFPRANERIIKYLQLPDRIAITPEAGNFDELGEIIDRLLNSNLNIIYFRQKTKSIETYLEWFNWANLQCKSMQVKLMFSQELQYLKSALPPDISAYHATSQQLLSLGSRPVSRQQLFSASCHDLQQLKLAEALDADFVFLSPVNATGKYADEKLLGWDGFKTLVAQVNMPVYALGGLDLADIETCKSQGGFGIAGISTFMPD